MSQYAKFFVLQPHAIVQENSLTVYVSETGKEAAPAAAPFWTKLRFNANCFWATEERGIEAERASLYSEAIPSSHVPSSHCPTLILQLGSLLRLILFIHLFNPSLRGQI